LGKLCRNDRVGLVGVQNVVDNETCFCLSKKEEDHKKKGSSDLRRGVQKSLQEEEEPPVGDCPSSFMQRGQRNPVCGEKDHGSSEAGQPWRSGKEIISRIWGGGAVERSIFEKKLPL